MERLSVYSHNYILDSLEIITANKDLTSLSVTERIPVVTLVAFLYEAIANHYGQLSYQNWKRASAQKSPVQKITMLYKHKGAAIDLNKHPFTTLKNIFTIRNALAHSKTHLLPINSQTPQNELPEPTWILLLKSINLDAVLNDQKLILKNLPELLGLEQVPSLILAEVRGP